MNTKEYVEIYNNINKYPKYEIMKEKLYRIKRNIPRLVIKLEELEEFMYLLHDYELSAHFGIRAIQDKAKKGTTEREWAKT